MLVALSKVCLDDKIKNYPSFKSTQMNESLYSFIMLCIYPHVRATFPHFGLYYNKALNFFYALLGGLEAEMLFIYPLFVLAILTHITGEWTCIK